MGFPHIIKDCTGRFSPVAFARVDSTEEKQAIVPFRNLSYKYVSDERSGRPPSWVLEIKGYRICYVGCLGG